MPWSEGKERIKQNKQTLLAYKKGLKCTKCGLDDHRLLEFHHLGAKDKDVSRMVNTGYGWKTVQKEIDKCIPLCCNCHRLEHWKD